MRLVLVSLTSVLLLFSLDGVVCPAIPSGSHDPKDNEINVKDHSLHEGTAGPKDKVDQELDDLGLEYGRYLQQVVSALEADKEFSSKLENASVEAIKSGQVAEQLHFVDHNIRSKLDELKRIEIERLHKLTMKEKLLKDRMDHESRVKSPTDGSGGGDHHIDRQNPHSFEVEDLHRLILAATKDLEAIDERRKQEFKEYEMRKELEFRSQLANASNETERVKLVQEHEQAMKRHADHPKVHHPGSKAQLEEVWQEEDHLPKNDFDPKTFFSLHDLNADGYLDVQEVEALLSLEVRKLYDPQHNPEAEDDPKEMMEEFHRMREHIYREADKDRDGLISRKEFLDMTSRPDFESSDNEGWKDIGSDPSAGHRGNFDEADLRRYYETMHEQAQRLQHQAVGAAGNAGGAGQHNQQQLLLQQQQQQYYGYEHAPPPPEYYGYHPGQGVPQHLSQGHPQQQPQQQPQFVPLSQQHTPQQLAAAQQAIHAQQQQLHHQAQQVQRAIHEQQVNFNGQVYGMPQQQPQVQHQGPQVAPHAQQPQVPVGSAGGAPVAPSAAASAPTPVNPQQHQQQQQPQQHHP